MCSCVSRSQLQRPGEKIKDACTIAHYSHFSGSSQTGAARDGASAAHLSAALPTEMRNSGCTAWKSDTSPTEARKPPKAEFLTETRQGCSVVRWSGWWFLCGFVHNHATTLPVCLSNANVLLDSSSMRRPFAPLVALCFGNRCLDTHFPENH